MSINRYANYWLAFALCAAGTVFSALGNDPDWYWLLVSDANVGIWLFVAAILDGRRP